MKWLLISAILGAFGATAAINRSQGQTPDATIGAQTSNGRGLANNFGEPAVCRDGRYADKNGNCP